MLYAILSVRQLIQDQTNICIRSSDRTLPHVSEFNRSVILEMMQSEPQINSQPQEEIPDEKISELKSILNNYLQIYLPDNPAAWKWIILSCVYRSFICHKPMHPQKIVHYVVLYQNNSPIYYCPAKSMDGNTACAFCVCRKTQNKEVL
ncbi:MAG: DUF2115 family protein [Bilifractor sp.]